MRRVIPDPPVRLVGMAYARMNRAMARINTKIYSGKIVRPKHCSKCGKEGKIQAHHEDYDKPFEVTWLCWNCHIKRHIELDRAGDPPLWRGIAGQGTSA